MHNHPKQRTPRKGQRGASAIEYALLLALIAVVVFSAVSFFGNSTGGGFGTSKNCIDAAYNGNNSLSTACPAKSQP
ncbi:Flp family type IVb pilin [Aquihabitans sp. McL0605]|uniref:Flp family type IVb pilin n=1 Tax=Aquihabitans sp. McL0605 TaxID=3415671 RepID=UPI003CF5B650